MAPEAQRMQSTEHLTVVGDIGLARNLIVIHPNDGYDLGLLSLRTAVRIYTKATVEDFLAERGDSVAGTLLLMNECRLATLRMNLAWWKDLGKPRLVRLACDQGKVLISRE
jgi:hypothetical protein